MVQGRNHELFKKNLKPSTSKALSEHMNNLIHSVNVAHEARYAQPSHEQSDNQL